MCPQPALCVYTQDTFLVWRTGTMSVPCWTPPEILPSPSFWTVDSNPQCFLLGKHTSAFSAVPQLALLPVVTPWDWLRSIILALKMWPWSIIPHPPTFRPSWPCTFLFFLCCINDPSRRLTLPPVITAFSSFWCDFRTLGVSKDWGAFIVIRNRH